jgi:hypothetical protein
MTRALLLSTLVGLLVTPAAAFAAPPANDGPDAAVELAGYTAENGTPSELQGSADLREATPDAGVPRCLGPASFQRTAWFKLPAADKARRVRIAVPTKAGEPAELADVAAFVQPASATNTTEPQACDGPESTAPSALLDGAPTVVLHVPAKQAVLIQAGWPATATANSLLVSADATPLGEAAAPPGDRAAEAPAVVPGRLGALPLAGALLSEEDPAEPACPAAATVWRKVTIAHSGPHVAVAAGPSVTTLTAFAGATPSGDTAVACAVREQGHQLRTTFSARKGQVVWLRAGSDAVDPAAARLAVSGPCDPRPLEPEARTTGSVLGLGLGRLGPAVRMRIADGCLRSVRVTVLRGPRVIASASRSTLGAGTTTIRLRGVRLTGRLRVRVSGRDALRTHRPLVRIARTVGAR